MSTPSPEAKQAAEQIENLASDIECGYRNELTNVGIVQQAIDAATAKLVRALEAWREFPHPIQPHCDKCAKASIRAVRLTDAALTDTE